MGIEESRQWVHIHGRPIDRVRVELARGEAGLDDLVAALSPFQNPDGGFGRGLEPDVRLAGSSTLATVTALQTLSEQHAPADLEMVARAMRYLTSTMDTEARAWQFVPPNVDDAPHAPWWDFKDIGGYLLNPRAEIAGYYYQWSAHDPGGLAEELAERVVELVLAATELEMHDILSVDRLVQNTAAPDSLRRRLASAFYRLAAAAIATEPASWDDYGLTPLTVITDPRHPLAEQFSESIERNVAYLLSSQESNGSWQAPWTWYGRYPEAWPDAEPDIRAVVTAMRTVSLIRFAS